MLAPKKLPKRKLYIYVGVMALMIFGMFFLLYQNYRMTVKRTPIVFDIPAESGNSASVISENVINELMTEISDSEVTKAKIDEFNIFDSNKYKALKAGAKSDSQNIITGRRNPFAL